MSTTLFLQAFQRLTFFPCSIWKPNVYFVDILLQSLELNYNFNFFCLQFLSTMFYTNIPIVFFFRVAFSNPYWHRQILAEVLEQTRKQLIWLKTGSY